MASAPKKQPAPAPRAADTDGPVTHLLVKSAREGFRRGGRQWTASWSAVPLSQLSEKQLAKIENESMLTSRRVSEAEARELAGDRRGAIEPDLEGEVGEQVRAYIRDAVAHMERRLAEAMDEVDHLRDQLAAAVQAVNASKAPAPPM
jgi:hypothetical protein